MGTSGSLNRAENSGTSESLYWDENMNMKSGACGHACGHIRSMCRERCVTFSMEGLLAPHGRLTEDSKGRPGGPRAVHAPRLQERWIVLLGLGIPAPTCSSWMVSGTVQPPPRTHQEAVPPVLSCVRTPEDTNMDLPRGSSNQKHPSDASLDLKYPFLLRFPSAAHQSHLIDCTPAPEVQWL